MHIVSDGFAKVCACIVTLQQCSNVFAAMLFMCKSFWKTRTSLSRNDVLISIHNPKISLWIFFKLRQNQNVWAFNLIILTSHLISKSPLILFFLSWQTCFFFLLLAEMSFLIFQWYCLRIKTHTSLFCRPCTLVRDKSFKSGCYMLPPKWK